MLLERDGELSLMAGLLTEVGSAGGKVVLIRGEAGIGKTALVNEFVQRHSDEAHVHVGSCDDLLVPQALSPFWDMARSAPSLQEPVDAGDRPRLLEALMDLLSRSLRTNILVIEDTHWADEATLDVIKFLGRRIARTSGLLVLTYRDGEVDYDHPLRRVIGDLSPDSVVRIQLGGLSLQALASIVAESSLDPYDVLLATNGNAFLVKEMVAADGEVVPSSVQDSVMIRVQKLSSGAQKMLKALSVIPEPLTRTVVLGLADASEKRLVECEQRGLLDVGRDVIHSFQRVVYGHDNHLFSSEPPDDVADDFVAFRHELIRRAIADSLTSRERSGAYRAALDDLPEDTHPCLLVHCASEAGDIDLLVELAPRSARYAAATGGHREAINDFRLVGPHLHRLGSQERAALLDEWAHEEFLMDNVAEATRLSEEALVLHEDAGDLRSQSRTLAQAAHYVENDGQRSRAEELAHRAVDVLGPDPDGPDLARALEANAYLQWMAMNESATLALVDRTLEAGGPGIDERTLIRSLVHRGVMASITDYPTGRASLDEARDRAEAAGEWYEEARALGNHAWAAAEARDVSVASDYAQRAIASSARHELSAMESYNTALYARVLELTGEWADAEDLARGQLEGWALSQMVALPIIGMVEARSGRIAAASTLEKAWELSSKADEFQRLGPTARAVAEHAWITGRPDVPVADLRAVVELGIDKGFQWTPGAIALWLWKLDELSAAPEGIAEPYRLMIEGDPMAAAELWANTGCPYDRAIALSYGDEAAQLEALEVFETLGATAVAAKLRKAMRDQGLSVPRGKGQATRSHVAGLTARQAEVLELLDEGLSNTQIADRLFLSPRTVENHVSAVLSKLDCSTREEAVSRAHAEGLLSGASD